MTHGSQASNSTRDQCCCFFSVFSDHVVCIIFRTKKKKKEDWNTNGNVIKKKQPLNARVDARQWRPVWYFWIVNLSQVKGEVFKKLCGQTFLIDRLYFFSLCFPWKTWNESEKGILKEHWLCSPHLTLKRKQGHISSSAAVHYMRINLNTLKPQRSNLGHNGPTVLHSTPNPDYVAVCKCLWGRFEN